MDFEAIGGHQPEQDVNSYEYSWEHSPTCATSSWVIEERMESARGSIITVDDKFWIWFHDYHSTHWTAVGHDRQNENEGAEKRDVDSGTPDY